MRQPPCMVLICPPLTHGTDAILREGGQRQVWRPVRLDAPQLDYYTLEALQPGWACWENEGRYLSSHTLGFLSWAALSTTQPLPPGL